MKPKVILTPGDPSGIGPEIILKSINAIKKICNPIVFASKKLFETVEKEIGIPFENNFEIIEINEDFQLEKGKLSFVNGRFSAIAIKMAVQMCIKDKVKAIVTAPINKEAIQGAGFNFPGHTEYLMYLANSNKTRMLFYSKKFSVLLHTIHIPLLDVFKHVNEKDLKKDIAIGTADFKNITNISPEIVVCGINPHAGENGKIGNEDFKIKQAVLELKDMGLNISGPYPADTLFSKIMEKDNHVLVYAMYHDQGLIPIKTLYPKTSINVTLGLPFIRTSVNHGTAFDIAWKGIADETNFIEANKTAVDFIRRKNEKN